MSPLPLDCPAELDWASSLGEFDVLAESALAFEEVVPLLVSIRGAGASISLQPRRARLFDEPDLLDEVRALFDTRQSEVPRLRALGLGVEATCFAGRGLTEEDGLAGLGRRDFVLVLAGRGR
jgi:hypothetical protein